MGPPSNRGSWDPPVSLPKLKKAYEKGTRDISWGPLLTPGPRAVPEFPNGQSAPAYICALVTYRNSLTVTTNGLTCPLDGTLRLETLY
ncbi:unnamed protein product [Staurois parvus]|uniref:Uncharacterized protein n=1 Tax=Staurois parvus TaxID=386267 RepID=A0ABN9DI30_9NEOB|nr:unnamed protein product [Staurois parvus]